MKKVILVMLVTLHSLLLFGQGATATLPTLTENPGTVTVPVNVTAFNNVAAITLYFEYDPAVVTFISSNSAALSGLEVNALTVGSSHRIGMVWSASGSAGSNVSGLLVNLVFTYTAGNGNFTFIPSVCEVVDNNYLAVSVSYTNGSIAQSAASSASINIPQFLNQAPTSNLAIPLNVDFSNVLAGVSAFTFVIEYDETKLSFQSAQNQAFGDIEVFQQSNPTRLSIQWVDAVNPGTQMNGKLLDMVFNYIGGTAPLAFDVGSCAVADHNTIEVPAVYSNGLVSEPIVSVTAGTITATPGNQVLIPVNADNFSNIAAFDLFIDYSQSVLGFVDLVNINPAIDQAFLASNSTASGVGINWNVDPTDLSGLTIPSGEKLFDMKFDYSSGSTALTFDQGLSAISDFDLTGLPVNYINGAISPVSGVTAVIPDVVASPGASVEVPVNVTGFDNIAALTMYFEYDPAVVTFTGYNSPALSGLEVNDLVVGASHRIGIVWSASGSGGSNVSGLLVNIVFNYVSGTGNFTFLPASCEVVDNNYQTITVAYTDGSISPSSTKTLNLNLFLEGLYNTSTHQMNKAQDFVSGNAIDKYPGTVAEHITVELHDAANYATLIYQVADVVLNQDGTAAISIPASYPGSYYITVRQRNHIESVSGTPISFSGTGILFNFSNAVGQVFGNNQKLLETGVYGFYAGDVNQDGFVNASDRTLVNSGVIAINKGYIPEDVNGDGTVNATDRTMANSAVINIVHRLIP